MIDLSRPIGLALVRALGLRGSAPLSFDGTVQPVVQVANLDGLPYSDEETFSFYVDTPGLAAQYTYFTMQPPTGYILVLELWRVVYCQGGNVVLHTRTSDVVQTNMGLLDSPQAGQLLRDAPMTIIKKAPQSFRTGTSSTAVSGFFLAADAGSAAARYNGPDNIGPWACDSAHQLAIAGQTLAMEVALHARGRFIRAAG